ncbi:MAG: radical SAM protein [bacterium]|nr:radical SAM protein [bacterium]
MKLTLIYPDQSHRKRKAIRNFFRAAPLNLLILAGLTSRDTKVQIIDERYEPINFDEPVDLVGITAITSIAPRAYQIGDEFKKRGVPVVLGGMHPSFLPNEAIKHATSVVIGEAELLWPELLNDFRAGKLKKFYRSCNYSDLQKIPFPRWDILPHSNRYVYLVQTTRGCPNNCAFCSVTPFSGKRIRTRPVHHIIDEIKASLRRFVVFIDDNIFAKPKYAKELFQSLIPLRIKWGGEASLNFMKNTEVLKLAAKSGCRILFIGVESVSQKALDGVNKGFNKIKEFKSIVQELHKLGIAVFTSLMFGFDEDDKGVFKRTVKFLNETKVDGSIFSILTPLPGTKFYESLKRAGRIFKHDWSKFDALHATYLPQKMSPHELEHGLNWTYRKFYSAFNTFRRIIRGWHRGLSIVPVVNIGYFIGTRRGLITERV